MAFDDVPELIRKRMSVIRKSGGKPERAVRSVAHALGYRFRINRRDLPGTPDVVFPRLRKIIFVHGCFWHQHERCRLANLPRTRTEYWLPKFERTQRRDAENIAELAALGWDVMVIWECEIADRALLRRTLKGFLSAPVA